MNELPLAASESALATITAAVHTATEVALDTEFVREKTYYPELCLIQIATPTLIAGIDCLAQVPMDDFLAALLHPDRIWVLHSARQDLEVVWNLGGRLPGQLVDTQIAGALLGMAPQSSLQKLLEDTVGIRISKDQTRAQWNRRPLPDAALQYALNDVRYLLDAWRVLDDRLAQAGRRSWLSEECERLLATSPEPTAASVLERTKGVGGLRPEEQKVALAIVEWRENLARRRNLPRRWILADDVLLKIARAKPQTPRDLAAVDSVPARLAQRHGADLLTAIRSAPSLPWPAELDAQQSQRQPDKARLKAIQTAIRERAEGLGIAAELLATRRDAAAIEAGNPPDYLVNGWRAEILRDIV